LDTGKAGLWPGGLVVVRGQTRYGESDIARTGAISPVNTSTLYPEPELDVTALSDLYILQFLSPQFAVIAGKMSMREANVFASDETTQFMNSSFNFNMACGTTFPLDFLGAGFLVHPTKWLMITTLFLDSEGEANQSGFDTAFHRGMSIYQNAEFTIKPFDLTGHQRVSWTWSDKERIQFSQNSRGLIEDVIQWKLGLGPKPTLATKDNDWSIMYDFDQFIYNLPGKPDKGLGVFGRFGVTSGEVNPIGSFYSIGIGGKGMIPGRENDTFGIGYYYLGLSDKLPRVIRHRTEDEQGVELFYNIAVTPWLHITPDLQIIDPAISRVGTVVVGGLRIKIDF
jgi:porin